MRKRLVAFLMAMVLIAMGAYLGKVQANAETVDEDIDISYLFTEDALIGYAVSQTRGVYLAEGVSIINDAGSGKIGWGGITNAAIRCTVSTNAIVERKVDGSWVRVTSSTTTSTDSLVAAVSKSTSVTSGYYYRCRCVHRASTDVSNTCTSSLWM